MDITCCKYSTSSDYFASGSKDGTIKIYNTKSTNILNRKLCVSLFSTGQITTFDWMSGSYEYLMYGNSNQIIKLFDMHAGKDINEIGIDAKYPLVTSLRASPIPYEFAAFIYSPPRREGKIIQGNWKSLKISVEIPCHFYVTDIAFYSDGKLLIAASQDGTIKICSNGTVTNSWKAHDSVLSLRLNSDNTRLLSIGSDCTIKEWDLTDNINISFLKSY